MTNPPRVMLLIDADNVSTDVIEQAISRLHAEYGALHVRRAYGTAEAAVKHQKLFKRLSIKPMVNLAAGKNSTDIALAVDAIDLVLSERPDVVVIASSDSDFAPLVTRIREKGCLVRGVGQKGKVGEETPLIYDEFIEFEHRTSRRHTAMPAAAPAAAPAARRTRARKAATDDGAAAAAPTPATRSRARKKADVASTHAAAAESEAAPGPEPIDAPQPKSSRRAATKRSAATAPAQAGEEPAATGHPARKTTRKTAPKAEPKTAPKAAGTGARKRAAAPARAPAPPMPEKVARAFEVLPALAAGERLDVQNAAAVLRKERVFSNADSWPKFFDRYQDWFDLTPHGRPTHVQRRAPA